MNDHAPPPPPPAGWLPDPDQPGTQRYWDGSAWTDQRAPAGAISGGRGRPAAFWVALGAIGLVIAGAIGPWVSAGFVSASGLEGDGILTIILALIAGGLMLASKDDAPRFALALLGLLIAGVAGYHVYEIETRGGLAGEVSRPGWGLLGTGVGGAVMMFSSLYLRRQSPR